MSSVLLAYRHYVRRHIQSPKNLVTCKGVCVVLTVHMFVFKFLNKTGQMPQATSS